MCSDLQPCHFFTNNYYHERTAKSGCGRRFCSVVCFERKRRSDPHSFLLHSFQRVTILMTIYKIRELPNIDDPDLIRCCVVAQQMRGTLCDLTRHIVAQLDRIPVTISTRVALAAINRMTEGSLSIEILCMKNRVRDAAILILSLIELKLDVLYIALDPTRAATWIDHEKEHTKPWKVHSQMREIYTDQKELDSEQHIYRQYSMVKHCNPIGGVFSFPVVVSRDSIQLDLEKNNSQWIRIHLFALGSCLHHSGAAASSIWANQGFDIGSFESVLKEGVATLSRYNEEHIVSLLRRSGW